MTLRCTLEVIPFGDESKAKVIRTINISNITFLEGRGSHPLEDVYVVEVDKYKEYDTSNLRINHIRSDGAQVLVQKVLEKLNEQKKL